MPSFRDMHAPGCLPLRLLVVGRYDTLRLIESLDPETEYWRIHRLHVLHEFPWDVTRALELALYRTYAVPSTRGAARPYRRVPQSSPEALRRHRVAARRGARARLRQPARQGRRAQDQPGPPSVRHLGRR